jgi:hypothetical protein
LQAQPLRVEKEVRDHEGGRPKVVGSKFTVTVLTEMIMYMRWYEQQSRNNMSQTEQ